jgi:hypothetical protein
MYFKILICIGQYEFTHMDKQTQVHVLLFILKYCFVFSCFTVDTFPSTTVSETVTAT